MTSVGELKAVAQQLAAKTAEAVDKERAALRALQEQEREIEEAASSLKGEEDDDERWALQEKRQVLARMREAVTGKLATLERQQALAAAAMLAPLEEAEQSNLVDIREEYDEALHGPLRQRLGFGAGWTSGSGPKSANQARETAASDDKTLMARLDELEAAEEAAAANGQARMPAAHTHAKTVHDKSLGTAGSGVTLPVVRAADVARSLTTGGASTSAKGSGVSRPSQGAGHSQAATSGKDGTAANLGNDGHGELAGRKKGMGVEQGHKSKPASSGLRAGFFNAAPRGKTSRSAATANPTKETAETTSYRAPSHGVGSQEGSASGAHPSVSGTLAPPLHGNKTADAPEKAVGDVRESPYGNKTADAPGKAVWNVRDSPPGDEHAVAPETAVGNVQERGANPTAGSGHVGSAWWEDGQGLGGGRGFGCFSGDSEWEDFSAELGLIRSEEGGEIGLGEKSPPSVGMHLRRPDHVPEIPEDQGQERTDVGEGPSLRADGLGALGNQGQGGTVVGEEISVPADDLGALGTQGQGGTVVGEGPSLPADGLGALRNQGQGRTVVGQEPSVPADGRPMTKGRKVSLFMQQRAQMKKSAGVETGM